MNIGKKKTGGRYIASKKKKKHSLGRPQRIVKINETKKKIIKTRGGNIKPVLLASNKVNLMDKKGKTKVTEIKNVLETKANRFWARQNILVKGAVIETPEGKAQITNRPGQEGFINAILLE